MKLKVVSIPSASNCLLVKESNDKKGWRYNKLCKEGDVIDVPDQEMALHLIGKYSPHLVEAGKGSSKKDEEKTAPETKSKTASENKQKKASETK